ncbi:MAG: DNA mismatch repair endonuclease MutL, partial [Spirochaetales bacterium]|nr:DNA mismatch repair endonuclease MutL [Spirochaetales bacterium]
MSQIRKLDPIVASRIAAGEVVERPSSVLRELLDNSIDAGATKISVYIEQGGIKRLTITDDGCGMDKEDLALACESHATSKVKSLEDLFNLRTLGFRGEALSSISACSKLTIDSNGNRIIVDNGEQGPVIPGSVSEGTTVCMEDLFENIPARKLFLKRPQSEASECKKTFIEKALGFPDVEFLFFSDGELKLHLPKADRQTRSVQIMKLDKAFMPAKILQMSCESDNVSLFAISSDPSCHRRDRTQIRILVNNRVIDSYQFVQAIASAFSVSLPGGAYPYFYLFIEDNPSLVDFNIHPTKRECKMRNQSQIYGAITTMIRKALTEESSGKSASVPIQEKLFTEPERTTTYQSRQTYEPRSSVSEKPSKPYAPSSKPFDPSWFENAKAILSKRAVSEISTTKVVSKPDYKYIGQLFNTFLLVEMDDRVLFIDQHALHERLLFDEIRS